MSDSKTYLAKKSQFDRLLTLYGRNAVLEALNNKEVQPQRLHLSEKNRPAKVIDNILRYAEQLNIEVRYHNPAALSRISKNAKQDQGVALDVRCPDHKTLDDFLLDPPDQFKLIALDGITNPQNLGMAIRSITASPIDGILLSRTETPKLSPLVIKASAGALFRAPIIKCEKLVDALRDLKKANTDIFTLESQLDPTPNTSSKSARSIYILGNETKGVSPDISKLATRRISIPMNRGVESLNVAVTAALVAFSKDL